MGPAKGNIVGGNNRHPWGVIRQVYTNGLCWSSNVPPSGSEVTYADRPRGRRVNGPGGGGIGKQVSVETDGDSEHFRKADEATGPRIQEDKDQDTKTTEATDEIQLTSLAYSERLVESLLSGESLSKIEHRECLRRSSRDKQDIKKKRAEAQIDREKRSENNKGRLWL